MSDHQILIPRKLIPVFTPARGDVRYRGAYGGRGSAKSATFARMAAIFGAKEKLRILCTRDLQASIKESFFAEVKQAILTDSILSRLYVVGENYIRGHNGTEFLFRGLRHNMSAIKSIANIDIVVIEEAEDVPISSWVDLEPTIRAPKSEIWIIWNPRREKSHVDELRRNPPPRSVFVEINHQDNPWFPTVLEELRQYQLKSLEPAMYDHIWNGDYLRISNVQVFNNKFVVEEFEPHQMLWNGAYNGLDFGFAQDPTAVNRMWIHEDVLYIEYEANKLGLELDDTADFIKAQIPDIEHDVIRADNARPESISYLKRHGLPRVEACIKGKGSVEDGVEFIKSFRKVVIHPRCVKTIEEFKNYSYKVDRLTGEILPIIVDDWNHHIDAIRYGLEPIMRNRFIDYDDIL